MPVKLKPSNSIMKSYGGGKIHHKGSAYLKVSHGNRSTKADFKVVQAPGNPSILGCRQALELGIISLNVCSLEKEGMKKSYNLPESEERAYQRSSVTNLQRLL